MARGAGEGALFVAEQLALEQRRRQRRAVDAGQRPRPRRQVVQRLGEHLLADAGLAEDEHVDPALGDVAQQRRGRGDARIDHLQQFDAFVAGQRRRARRAHDDERQPPEVEGVADGERQRVAAAAHLVAHARAVGRAEILHGHRRAQAQDGVAARQRLVRERDVAVARAADHQIRADERKRGDEPGAGDEDEAAAVWARGRAAVAHRRSRMRWRDRHGRRF
jgi:hypothetical protein